MTKTQKIRMWARNHRGLIRFVFSLIMWFFTVVFWFAAASVFYPLPLLIGPSIMAGVILLMICGWFFRNATDFADWGQEPEDLDEAVERIDLNLENAKEEILDLLHRVRVLEMHDDKHV